MTRIRVRRVICIGVCAAVLAACTAEQQNQGLGALIGAAGGAATGALAGGGDTKAILAGATAGAVVGWAAVKLTQYHAEKTASAQQVATLEGYKTSDGTVVKIRGFQVNPTQVTAGETVELSTDYAVLAPSEDANVPVTETIELWKDDKLLQKLPAQEALRQPGGYKIDSKIPMPSGAPQGTYIVKTLVDGGGSYDERETHFVLAN